MVNNENTQSMHVSRPQPDPALKRLEKLVGTWKLTGRTLSSKEDNITGWTTFEWMPGGIFSEIGWRDYLSWLSYAELRNHRL